MEVRLFHPSSSTHNNHNCSYYYYYCPLCSRTLKTKSSYEAHASSAQHISRVQEYKRNEIVYRQQHSIRFVETMLRLIEKTCNDDGMVRAINVETIYNEKYRCNPYYYRFEDTDFVSWDDVCSAIAAASGGRYTISTNSLPCLLKDNKVDIVEEVDSNHHSAVPHGLYNRYLPPGALPIPLNTSPPVVPVPPKAVLPTPPQTIPWEDEDDVASGRAVVSAAKRRRSMNAEELLYQAVTMPPSPQQKQEETISPSSFALGDVVVVINSTSKYVGCRGVVQEVIGKDESRYFYKVDVTNKKVLLKSSDLIKSGPRAKMAP
eukprot:PhF_6_TR22202/c0_g1_i2/m.31332